MRECLRRRWAELMTFVLTTTSEVMLTLGALEVADGKVDRKHLGFLDAFLEVHPLLGVEVLTAKAIKVPCT